MIKPLSQSMCEQARAYYYDYICEENGEPIPKEKAEHINQCRHCQATINKLRSELFETTVDTNKSTVKADSVLISNLKLHFAYIGKKITCENARPFLPCLLHKALEIRIPTPITVHIDNCEQCQKDLEIIRGLNLSRKQLLELSRFMASKSADGVVDCRQVKFAISPEADMSVAKMQNLQKAVCQVVRRPESGVVTIYHIDTSDKTPTSIQRDSIYAGFPIRVEVMNCKEKIGAERTDKIISFADIARKKISAMTLNPLFKTAVVAAAVMMIAAALFFHTPAAKAITIDEIFKAISDIKNVYIAKFTPDSAKSRQELWVSRTLQLYMNRTEDRAALWDVGNGLQKMKNLITNNITVTPLNEETIAVINGRISGHLGLVPFTNTSEIPADAQWKQITDIGSEAAATEEVEVYDLIWTKKASDGSDIFRKWRVFVDPKTNLPQKTEFYEKLPADIEYLLQSVNVVEYLDYSEIQTVLTDFSF
jgi:hypothetical protein